MEQRELLFEKSLSQTLAFTGTCGGSLSRLGFVNFYFKVAKLSFKGHASFAILRVIRGVILQIASPAELIH